MEKITIEKDIMRVRPGGTKMSLWQSEESAENTVALRDFYRDLMGRPLSTTIIIRRALERLLEHTASIESDADKLAEITSVYRHVGRD